MGLAAKWVSERRNRLQERIRTRLADGAKARILPIERVRDIGPEEFYREWVRPGIPVLMEGMAVDWPCTVKWSMDWFAERYGDDEVVVTEGTIQTVKSVHKDTVSLRDVIRNNTADSAKYLRFHPMLAEHPELGDDIPIEWFNAYQDCKSRYYQAQFFIVEMKADDVLWNPPFYWHCVSNCTDTIGVGYRWKSDARARGQG